MCTTRKTIQAVLVVLSAACTGAAVFLFSVPGDTSSRALGAPLPNNPREAQPAEPLPFPDGVIDRELRTAFVSSPKGGIQAIRLKDGKVLWTNDDCAAQPWLVAGDRLIARGERLVVFDLTKEGKLLRQCEALAYAKVDIPDRCTVAFHLWDPRVTGDNLELNWYCVASIDRGKGRPFPFEAWTAFNKAVPVGTARIHLDTGKGDLQTDPKPADVTGALIPEAAKPEQRMPAGMAEKLAAVWRQYHKDQNGRITVLGERLVGVSMALEPAGPEFTKKVVLNAWDLKTGKAADPVELVKDKAINIANIVLTEDGRHAAVVFGTSALAIYSLTDGKLVAKEVKGVSTPEKAFVDGTRLYYCELAGGRGGQTPNTLKALDLESGKVVWEHELKPQRTIPLPP
jgi:hypothetical protein